MYIIVRYGDSKEAIFNPNCRIHNLLLCIKRRCMCTQSDEIDLSDETGNVKFLREVPNRYANEILGDRETLVLLRVDSNGGGEMYVPLLNDDDVTDDFKARLSNKIDASRPGSKRSKSNVRRNPRDPDQRLQRERSKEKQRGSARTEKRSKSRQGKG